MCVNLLKNEETIKTNDFVQEESITNFFFVTLNANVIETFSHFYRISLEVLDLDFDDKSMYTIHLGKCQI